MNKRNIIKITCFVIFVVLYFILCSYNVSLKHKKQNDEYNKLTKSFLSYINALPTTNKFPSLKSSRVDSIKDCFSIYDLKTLTCSISYTIIPNETDLSKSIWLENGTIEKGAIKKSHYVTFNNDSEYKFVKISSNI